MSFESWFEDFERSMRLAEERRSAKQEEHNRLLAEPYSGPINVGDRIMVRKSFVGAGIGHQWEIAEFPVLEVTKYAVRIERQVWNGGVESYWIGRELILDVLPPKEQPQ